MLMRPFLLIAANEQLGVDPAVPDFGFSNLGLFLLAPFLT